ncbi:MAG: DinB family protein [Flavisolibacter sp.]
MLQVDFSRVPVFYHKYINLVKEQDLSEALRNHQNNLASELNNIPESTWDYRYAEGKWTIKELVQHIIDGERIFCYRALNFARKDSNELPGFDENEFAAVSNADKRSKKDLLDELTTVQKSSMQLFASFDEEQLDQSGTANGNSIYVKGIGFIIVGHTLHHLNIIRERYLQKKIPA